MPFVIRAGLILGILVEVWTFVMGFTGWYKDPALLNLFWVVILIQIGVLVWALRRTAAEGRSYVPQVMAGSAISVVAGVVVIGGSLLFTTVFFPNYFQELAAIQEQMLRQSGQTDAQVRAAMDASAGMNTPVANAVMGCVGTVVTGLAISLITSAFVRARK